MLPFAPQTATTFWQQTADSVAADEHIVLVTFDAERTSIGTVQLIPANRKTSPIVRMSPNFWFTKMPAAREIAHALMSELEHVARQEGRRRCWCWTRQPVAGAEQFYARCWEK